MDRPLSSEKKPPVTRQPAARGGALQILSVGGGECATIAIDPDSQPSMPPSIQSSGEAPVS